MKRTLIALIIIAGLAPFTLQAQNKKTMNLPAIDIHTLQGAPLDLSKFRGKKILFVNVASECGYTPQYADLQELYSKNSDKLEIIGVPCNQFGGQEPGTAKEIAEFCSKNYGVTFTMTEKIDVKGENQHPLYQWLTSKAQNGVADATVKWNFHKFLLNESGELIKAYASGEMPRPADL